MTTHNKCKACGKTPAPHRTFAQFSNILITQFFTCSKECALDIIQTELTKGVECIKPSVKNHAFAECNCGAVQPDEYKETLCSICGKPQFTTPSGDTCENGHGGAPPR